MTFNVYHYDKNKEKQTIKFGTKSETINQICSNFDTIFQLKSKLCVYAKIAKSPDDIYVWIDEINSPFNENGKYSNYKSYDIIPNKNHINIITKDNLDIVNGANWIKDLKNIKSKPLTQETINNIKLHSDNVTKLESEIIPSSKLKENFVAHSAILADITQNKENINLDRLFKKFQLNKNVPVCRLSNLEKIQTKIFSPAVGMASDEKFWSRFTSEKGNKQKHLQFKFEFIKTIVYVSLHIDGNLKLACHSEISNNIDINKWRNIYENIVNWIIIPINNITENTIENYLFENIKYRNIITSIYLKKNININTNLIEQFNSNIPFFTYDVKNDKKRLKFIKISNYQNPEKRIQIAKEFLGQNISQQDVASKLGILFIQF